MSHPERVEDYLEHIADAIERAMRYIADLEDLAALERDEKAPGRRREDSHGDR